MHDCAHTSSDRKQKNETCPLLVNPQTYCYCSKAGELSVDKAIHYCYENYENCEYYAQMLKAGNRSAAPL